LHCDEDAGAGLGFQGSPPTSQRICPKKRLVNCSSASLK